MTFDVHKAREICKLSVYRSSRARAMVLGFLGDHPLMKDDRIDAVIDAAEMLPVALDRIEELEKALIAERACRMVYGPEDCIVPDEAMPCGGLEDCYCIGLDDPRNCPGFAHLRSVARDQLHSEGLI